jgi:hypothetical protein
MVFASLRRPGAARALLASLSACALLAGCASTPWMRRWSHPVTVAEVVQLSRHGVAPDAIIAKMNRAGTVYNLSESQYAEIRKRGVTPQVIAYMKGTYRQAVEKFPKLAHDETMSCWYLGYDGMWYGGGAEGFHPDC